MHTVMTVCDTIQGQLGDGNPAPNWYRSYEISLLMVSIEIHMQSKIQWIATASEEPGVWVAHCDPLGISLTADSLDEMHSLIDEACQLLFLDLFQDNELDRFLAERGWESSVAPTDDTDDVEFLVPWNMIASGGHHDSTLRTH